MSESLKDKVLNLVNLNISNKQIAILLDTTRNKVHKIIKKEGLSRKASFYLKHDFFEKIDTEAKAYFLGFLYSDGFVSSDSNKVGISLHEKDSYILEEISKHLYVDPSKSKLSKNRQMKSLSVYSDKMKNDLILLGCVPQKTFILKFPPEGKIPTTLMNHFIRGVFDGDGCASITTRKSGVKRFRVLINSGSESFIDCLIGFLKTDFPKIKKSCCNFWKRKNPYYGMHIGHSDERELFYKYLYKDATLFLNRKKQKFEFFKENEA